MQNQNPKIPKHLIPAPEDYLQQRIQLRYENFIGSTPDNCHPSSKATEAVLLKYYPKYCRSLLFDWRNKRWSVLFRMRQIKTLQNFSNHLGSISGPLKKTVIKQMKHLFKLKRKSVKSLPTVNSWESRWFQNTVDVAIMELCPYFPEIQTLNIIQPFASSVFPNQENEQEVLKYYGYFWRNLRSIHHLEITTSAPGFWILLSQLQSSKHFLTSLKTLCLEVVPLDLPALNSNQSARFVFQSLLQNQDLLKYVTHLKFSRRQFDNFHCYGDQVKSIISLCSNIIFLSFPIGPEFTRTDRKHLTLAPLQSLQNVSILTLKISDTWSFLEAFEFPLKLKKLTIHLYYRSSWLDVWNSLYPQIDDGNSADEIAFESYEKYKVLLNFFEKLKRLTNLTSLDLNMPLFTEANELMSNFILPLIISIPKLENFECQLYYTCSKTINFFDFSLFLDGIASLQQLKSFKIFQRLRESEGSIMPGDLALTFNPLKSYFFPNLTSIHIDTWIHEDFDFKKFFKIFSTDLKEITLTKVYRNSINSFIHLLKFFNNLERLSSVQINITITLDLGDNFTDFSSFIYPFIPAKNVSITTNIYTFNSECAPILLSSTGLKTIQDMLKNLKVHIIFRGYNENGWSSVHIMKNNIPDVKELMSIKGNYF